MPEETTDILVEGEVLRLVKHKEQFLPKGAKVPTAKAFEPSTDDKKDAVSRNGPVRVSVWDLARTTAAQAKAFRSTEEEMSAFTLPVCSIKDVGVRYGRELRVVREPRQSTMPGAHGHCGIEGLDRAGKPRPSWLAMLCDLASSCVDAENMTGEGHTSSSLDSGVVASS